jgi:ABC-type phosphate/phosphonate transport system substrate-binding protein
MYNLSPTIRGLWDDLFVWLGQESGIALEIVAHAAPAPLSELWSRPDMGAVFMCGYPLSKLPLDERPQPLAAPVSTAVWAGGRPVYASQIVARRSSSIKLADLGTARWGWTVRDSQSGYHAPREFLARHTELHVAGETVGPLLNPRGVVEAAIDGRIDVGAIDAYAYQLLEMHEPDMVSSLRIVATTEPAPFPMLVAARQQPVETVDALRHALIGAHRSQAGRAVLAPLGLSGFAEPDMSTYAQLPERARQTDLALGNTW